jgi:lipopolysaccharide transport protein LptA
MAASIRKVLALIVLALPAGAGLAALPKQENILIDAQSSELDARNLVFHKVRIAQGPMSITADLGVATNQVQSAALDFENSRWDFRGNVKIAMDDGQLSSDEAIITFAKKLLARAVVTGKPASFQQKVAKTGKLAQGHADGIDYDVAKGVVHLSKNAWLSDGQTEIRGESLQYNTITQTIVAPAAEQGSQRVHIIITPQAIPKP